MKFFSTVFAFWPSTDRLEQASGQEEDAPEKEWFLNGTNSIGRKSDSRSVFRERECLFFSLVLQSLLVFILLVYIAVKRAPSDIECARQLSPYSPYLDTNGLEYEDFMEQNHLMQPSDYRGKPTEEIEKAWIHLWKVPPIKFPESKLEALNKTPPSHYTHVQPEYGDGVKGFIDVFHQLHCLNTIRQYTYREEWDYSNVTAFRAPDEVVRGHIDHCIETIRKGIMCTSDLTTLTFLESTGKPDFNAQRKCRNFWKIHEWAMTNMAF